MAYPGARADQRHPDLDGRPIPVLLELAAWRLTPVRYLRSLSPEAHRTSLAGRPFGQSPGRAWPPHDGRPANDPVIARWQTPVRDDIAVLDLGQPVLSRHSSTRRLYADGRLRH